MTWLRRILNRRWVIAIGAALTIYMLAGFLLVPFLVQRYVPAIASEKLQRPVALGKVRFNPLLFKLEIEDFALKEPQGEPLLTLGRLFADLELKSLVHRAWAFRVIRLEKLFVRPVIGEDGRLNFARLADAFPPSEEPEPPPGQPALPRLLIDRFVLADGAVEFVSQSRGQPVSKRVEAINLKVAAISTLPDNQASHHISASFGEGAVFDWRGQVSFNPLSSDGEVRLDGFKLATPWPFLNSRIALEPPDGQLSVASRYRFRQDGDDVELALNEIGATLGGLKLVPLGSKEPIAAVENIQVSHGSFGLADQSVKIPEFTIQKGQLKAAIDAQGALDWQRLAMPAPVAQPPQPNSGAVPPPQPPTSPKPWRVEVGAVKLNELALQLTDASRRIPVDFSVGALGLGFNLALEAGAGEPKASIGKLGSEVRNIVLKPIGGKDPILAIETFQLSDGAFDLASRNLKLPAVTIRKGSVRTEVDDSGAMNWQKLAETAAPSARSASPPAAPQAPANASQQEPWRVGVDQLKIEQMGVRYADDSRKSPIQVDIASFGLGLRAALEVGAGEPKVDVEQLQSDVRQIVLRERQREKPLASLESFVLSGGRVDLANNTIAIQQITLGGGDTAIERDEKGVVRLADVLAPKDPGKLSHTVHQAGAAAKSAGKPWRITLGQASLSGFHAAFTDRSVAPPSHLELGGIDFRLKQFSNDGKTPLTFDGKLHIAPGGDLSLQGSALPTGDRGQADVRLDRLDLTSLQPYVSQLGALKLESGKLSSRIKLGFQQKAGKSSLTARGEVTSNNLMLKEAKSGKRFAEWDKLAVSGIEFSLAPDKLAIKEIHAIKPGANLEIFEDRTTNIDAIFRPKASAPPAPKPKAGAAPAQRVAGKPFPFSVQRVKVEEAIFDFSDASLVLPFKTRIQNFGGTISGIANAPAARTLLKLDGRVDEYGEANLEGTLDLMQHSAYSDVTLIFRNVEMSSLSPYSGTFAGRRIQAGKLNAELQYKIENSNLKSKGKIELDRVALGAEVVSPKAKSLPLDLALALLTDNSGRITVSVPIEGNVNDPQFAYGSVIWDAIVNLITKAVTAPFAALAGAFGSGEQELGEIFFIPGKNGLPPAEIEKLKKLATHLGTRPTLVLKVEGTFDPTLDAEALKSWEVRTAVTEKLGIAVLPGEDPGPVAFDNARTQKALEDLADERGSQAAVASAQAAFRDQNRREPKRIGRLSSFMDKASEDAQFYRLLFDRLVASTPLPPKGLEALADRRSQAIAQELAVHKGVDRSRVRVGKSASTQDKDGRIPSKLDLAVGE